MLKILVIGTGGREMALAKKFQASPLVETVYCARGNDGMKEAGIQLVDIAEDNHQELIAFAKKAEITFTFVGPEVPLLNGIVDDFQQAGLKIFGPTKKAALIEGSKDFAKKIMAKYHIPTAKSQTFNSFEEALYYCQSQSYPLVLKADGLAAGKGVVICQNLKEAEKSLTDMFLNQIFGKSGSKVIIEEFLVGEEFSLLAFVDGENVYPMIPAQDHKRALDGDSGLNTGGMGAYAPVSHLPKSAITQGVEKVLIPCAKGLVEEGRSFTGILYAGLILTKDGVKTIEFNARFGDPETQVILPQLKSDLAEVVNQLLNHQKPVISWQENQVTMGVVVAACGYPKEYQKNMPLPLEKSSNVFIDYSGVKEKNHQLLSSGGRIFLVGASGKNLEEARQKVYAYLNRQQLKNTFYRKDIGFKGL